MGKGREVKLQAGSPVVQFAFGYPSVVFYYQSTSLFRYNGRVEIYTAIIATISAGAAVFSLIKFWPILTITVGFNFPRTVNKPIIDISIHNGKRNAIAIAKTGLHLAGDSEPFREHYHDSIGDTTVHIKPGADYSEQWQIDFAQEIKYVWVTDIHGKRYTGNIPKSVTQRIRQLKPKP